MSSVREVFTSNIVRAVKASAVHVQDRAQDNHKFKSRTGDLERSVDVRFSVGGAVGEVFLNMGIASHGPFVHQGTRPHEIFPKHRTMLRFTAGGRFVFAKKVNHPGTKKDAFLYKAFRDSRGEIVSIFERYTDKSVKEVVRNAKSNGLSRTFIWK